MTNAEIQFNRTYFKFNKKNLLPNLVLTSNIESLYVCSEHRYTQLSAFLFSDQLEDYHLLLHTF